jgi:hypothetical protein
MKHLKTFENYKLYEYIDKLYSKMGDLLKQASRIYSDFKGEECELFQDDVSDLYEIPKGHKNYELAQNLISEIIDLDEEMDSAQAEEYFEEEEEDEDED